MILMQLSSLLRRWKPSAGLTVAVLGALAAIGFAALLPQEMRRNESTDFDAFYEPVGRTIAAGEGVRLPTGELATRYPPGYPVFIAVCVMLSSTFGVELTPLVHVANVLFAGLAAWLVFRVSSSGFQTPGALAAALLWGAYPLQLWLTKQPSSECPFTVLLLMSCAFAVATAACRARCHACAFGAGASAGMAMLVRPIGIGVGIILAVFVLIFAAGGTRRRLSLGALLLAGNLAVIAPWEIYVYQHAGEVVPLSTLGRASVMDGLTFGARNAETATLTFIPERSLDIMKRLKRQSTNVVGVGGALSALLREARREPLGVLQLLVLKLARCFYGTDSQRMEGRVAMVQLPLLILAGGAIGRGLRRPRPVRTLAGLAAAMCIYGLVMDMASTTLARYFVPFVASAFATLPAIWGADARVEDAHGGD